MPIVPQRVLVYATFLHFGRNSAFKNPKYEESLWQSIAEGLRLTEMSEKQCIFVYESLTTHFGEK